MILSSYRPKIRKRKRLLTPWEVKTYHDKNSNQMYYMPTFYRYDLNERRWPVLHVGWSEANLKYRISGTTYPEVVKNQDYTWYDDLYFSDPTDGMSICDEWAMANRFILMTPEQMKKDHSFL